MVCTNTYVFQLIDPINVTFCVVAKYYNITLGFCKGGPKKSWTTCTYSIFYKDKGVCGVKGWLV